MNSKQFAWVYLLKNGDVGVKHSYYGGYDPMDKDWEKKFGSIWDNESYKKAKEYYLEEIKNIGVDWDKTEAPKSNLISEFNGTFNESSAKEIIEGDLILRNGECIHYVSDALDTSNIFEMMANVDKIKVEYYKLTNESPNI